MSNNSLLKIITVHIKVNKNSKKYNEFIYKKKFNN